MPPTVQSFYQENSCNKLTECGALIEVSCNPEGDGALAYFKRSDGELVMLCGGTCDLPPQNRAGNAKLCSVCPPPQWKQCKGVKSSSP